jgi:hypothetical protein
MTLVPYLKREVERVKGMREGHLVVKTQRDEEGERANEGALRGKPSDCVRDKQRNEFASQHTSVTSTLTLINPGLP